MASGRSTAFWSSEKRYSDPNYVQMSIYISRDVRAKVKMRLLATDGEFSGLVESLLREWLRTI